MEVKFRTINSGNASYLMVVDSDGADVSFLIQDGEDAQDCLERNIGDQQMRAKKAKANAERMLIWREKLRDIIYLNA